MNKFEKAIGLVDDYFGTLLLQLSETYKSLLQECKIHVGNTGILNKVMVVKITLLASPNESDTIDQYLTSKHADVYTTAKRKRLNSNRSRDSSGAPSTPGAPGGDSQMQYESVITTSGRLGLTPTEGAKPVFVNYGNLGIGVTEEIKTIEEIETDLDKLFSTSDHEDLPQARECGRVKTSLYSYQRQGLYWMQLQESSRPLASGEGFLGWERKQDKEGKEIWYNKATRQTRNKAPERWRGGILADEMGLGKTLQIICVIAATARDSSKHQKSSKGPFTTLIVCPLSVITNWELQCKRHLRKDSPLKATNIT